VLEMPRSPLDQQSAGDACSELAFSERPALYRSTGRCGPRPVRFYIRLPEAYEKYSRHVSQLYGKPAGSSRVVKMSAER